MNINEALEATSETRNMIAVTKSGAEYLVNRDIIETAESGYVYGERMNADPLCRFRRGRGAQNGDIRWFYLKSLTLVTPNQKINQ